MSHVIITIPLERRTPDDLVTRGDEEFRRGELDRTIQEPDLLFSMLGNGLPGYETGTHSKNTPSYVATEVVQATGSVAIADIGCGTGNTLFTWGCKVALRTPCSLGDISTTGISREDYSIETASADTLTAHDYLPNFQYVVGDAMHMPIPAQSQDVVLAYNSLIYATNPAGWLGGMARITKPGGVMFFNASFEQSREGQPLFSALRRLMTRGWSKPLINNLKLAGIPQQLATTNEPRQVQEDRTTVYRMNAPGAAQAHSTSGSKLL